MLVGPAIPYAQISPAEQERSTLVHEFATQCNHMLCNTWADGYHDELHYTRRNWNDIGEAQVDFMLASAYASIQQTSVDHQTHFNTDHRPVSCEVLMGRLRRSTQRTKCMRNWKPVLSWDKFVADFPCEWQCWDSNTTTWREAAEEHQANASGTVLDLELQALIAARKNLDDCNEEKRRLSKRVWRRRRHLRRFRELNRLDEAAASGRAPPRPQPSSHLNWLRIFGHCPA